MVINGKTENVKTQTIKNLLLEKGLNPSVVVVELNGSIVKRADWDTTLLQETDKLEIVSFVGGG